MIEMTERPLSLVVINEVVNALRKNTSDYEDYQLLKEAHELGTSKVVREWGTSGSNQVPMSMKDFLESYVSQTTNKFGKLIVSNLLANNFHQVSANK